MKNRTVKMGDSKLILSYDDKTKKIDIHSNDIGGKIGSVIEE